VYNSVIGIIFQKHILLFYHKNSQ